MIKREIAKKERLYSLKFLFVAFLQIYSVPGLKGLRLHIHRDEGKQIKTWICTHKYPLTSSSDSQAGDFSFLH